jgi:hypothetical protein
VLGGAGVGLVWLVVTPSIPRLAHYAVEFIGWWFLGGLAAVALWQLVVVLARVRRRSPYVG